MTSRMSVILMTSWKPSYTCLGWKAGWIIKALLQVLHLIFDLLLYLMYFSQRHHLRDLTHFELFESASRLEADWRHHVYSIWKSGPYSS